MVYNYSLFAIPSLWCMSLLTHAYATTLTKSTKDLDNFDNISPRDFIAKCREKKQTPIVAKYLRAEAAQQNSFEQIGLFASAVVAGNIARLSIDSLNLFTGLYLTSRLIYTLLYINTEQESMTKFRSITFVAGVGICFTLFIQAGNALNRSII